VRHAGSSATAELLVNSAALTDISGTAEARVVKFCIQVDYMESCISPICTEVTWVQWGFEFTQLPIGC